MAQAHYAIYLTGNVQGVGFRPYVWRLARQFQLHGWVANTGGAVTIQVVGELAQLNQFLKILPEQLPKAASLKELVVTELALDPKNLFRNFVIADSSSDTQIQHLPDDLAICSACLAELQDPQNRRYGHLFIHCTQCGPRYSCLESMPYDRANTSMADFATCAACAQEYVASNDRRFHAQTNGCFCCGPQYEFTLTSGEILARGTDVVAVAADWLELGKILAIKSTGGFRLACIAHNDLAVRRLREKKQRPDKPLALMATDVDMVRQWATVSAAEQTMLESASNPIVLLRALSSSPITEVIAPGQNRLGFMLPGNGFEYLLMQHLKTPIVMTSANVSGELLCTDNIDALTKLTPMVDGLVLHNRRITRRVDDSVVAVEPVAAVFRRGRGLSNQPWYLPKDFRSTGNVLALGAELKNTFCLLSQNHARLSPHLGDLKNAAVVLHYRDIVCDFMQLNQFKAQTIVVDFHRDYISTRLGQELADEWQIPRIFVQHHHAHLAAVMAEHGLALDTKIVGVVLDGLGMGDNGELWGGEFFLGGYRAISRFGRFQPQALPGGDSANIEPWRNSLAHLASAQLLPEVNRLADTFPHLRRLVDHSAEILHQAILGGINSPVASSAGRLFDAVAYILGITPQRISYEGQAALALQNHAELEFDLCLEAYPWALRHQAGLMEIQWQPFWQALLIDLVQGVASSKMAAKFHRMLVQCVCALVVPQCETMDNPLVVLAGGVMQNGLLVKAIELELCCKNIPVLYSQKIPANDGGISFGQAMVAAAMAQ